MADPWSILTPILQSAAVLSGIGLLFKTVVTDPINRANANADYWKNEYKAVVSSRRNLRNELETIELGAPSLPPPKPDEEEEDNTRRVRAVARADDRYEQERRQRPLNPGTTRALPFDTQQDYKDHRQRNAQQGLDTPTYTNPRKR